MPLKGMFVPTTLNRSHNCCCLQRPPYQLHTLLKKEQLPPLLLLLLLTVLQECMGADTVRLFTRPFWEAVGWTNARRGFSLEQIENGFYLLGECAAGTFRNLPGQQHLLGSATTLGCLKQQPASRRTLWAAVWSQHNVALPNTTARQRNTLYSNRKLCMYPTLLLSPVTEHRAKSRGPMHMRRQLIPVWHLLAASAT
jgi:hypothetical protein